MPSPRPLTHRRKPARDTRAQLEPTTPGPVRHEPGARRAHCAKASMPNPPRSPPPAATGSHDRHNSAERRQGSTPAFPSSLRVPGVVVVQRFSTALTNQTATQSRTEKSPSRKSPNAVIMPKRRRPSIIQPEQAHRSRHRDQPPARRQIPACTRRGSPRLSYATVSAPASSVQILVRNVSGFPSSDQMWNLYSPEPLMRGRLMTRRGPVTAKPVISTADPDGEDPTPTSLGRRTPSPGLRLRLVAVSPGGKAIVA